MSVRYVNGRACYPIPTVYTLDYRWPPFQEVIRRKDTYVVEATRTHYTREQAEALLKKLYRSRLRSTYDVSYTLPLSKRRSMGGKEKEEAAEEVGDEQDMMMMMFKKTYWEDTCPRPLPDLPGTIKVFGPTRPDMRLVGLSEYQDQIGKFGYNRLLNRDEDWETLGKYEEVDSCPTQRKGSRRPSGRVQCLEF